MIRVEIDHNLALILIAMFAVHVLVNVWLSYERRRHRQAQDDALRWIAPGLFLETQHRLHPQPGAFPPPPPQQFYRK